MRKYVRTKFFIEFLFFIHRICNRFCPVFKNFRKFLEIFPDILLGFQENFLAHPLDPYRLDVVIAGETHFYLKASSPHERQNWLVALGSVKACVNSAKAGKVLLAEDFQRKKQCELRLYCDLLMQQVHSIKAMAVDSPTPDVQVCDREFFSFFIKNSSDFQRGRRRIGFGSNHPRLRVGVGIRPRGFQIQGPFAYVGKGAGEFGKTLREPFNPNPLVSLATW